MVKIGLGWNPKPQHKGKHRIEEDRNSQPLIHENLSLPTLPKYFHDINHIYINTSLIQTIFKHNKQQSQPGQSEAGDAKAALPIAKGVHVWSRRR